MKNNPAEWTRVWQPEGLSSTGSATYPTDGRETIFEDYERVMPTTTVGELLAAYAAAMPFGSVPDPSLPHDFADYVLQRTGTLFRLEHADPDSIIDRFGGVYPATSKANSGSPTLADILKVKDAEGHEHGADGRFGSTGGGSSKPAKSKTHAAHIDALVETGRVKVVANPKPDCAECSTYNEVLDALRPANLGKYELDGGERFCGIHIRRKAEGRERYWNPHTETYSDTPQGSHRQDVAMRGLVLNTKTGVFEKPADKPKYTGPKPGTQAWAKEDRRMMKPCDPYIVPGKGGRKACNIHMGWMDDGVTRCPTAVAWETQKAEQQANPEPPKEPAKKTDPDHIRVPNPPKKCSGFTFDTPTGRKMCGVHAGRWNDERTECSTFTRKTKERRDALDALAARKQQKGRTLGDIMKTTDGAGHEHGADGKFTSGGGGTSDGPSLKALHRETKEAQAMVDRAYANWEKRPHSKTVKRRLRIAEDNLAACEKAAKDEYKRGGYEPDGTKKAVIGGDISKVKTGADDPRFEMMLRPLQGTP